MRWLKLTARIGAAMLNDCAHGARWEHFQHGADIGIRGIGPTKPQAFEQAALALTAVMTLPEKIQALTAIDILCNSADDEFLFLDWINALIFEMATRSMLFSRFQVLLHETTLSATAWGEPVDIARHCPAVEPKGATFTELAVRQLDDGAWIAQCVVDV
jgi:SHS2 domain-containing protein